MSASGLDCQGPAGGGFGQTFNTSGIDSRGRGPDQPRSFLRQFGGFVAPNLPVTAGGLRTAAVVAAARSAFNDSRTRHSSSPGTFRPAFTTNEARP